jgi:hypothetical protein
LGDIVPEVYDGDHLEADLEALRGDAATAGDVDLLGAFLDEIAGSEEARWQLLKWIAEHDARPGLWFNCKAVVCFQQDGYNVSRIQPLLGRLKRYRVLYSFEQRRNELHLLAVVIKRLEHSVDAISPLHYNYEPNHEISRRVRSEYDERGFTKLS